MANLPLSSMHCHCTKLRVPGSPIVYHIIMIIVQLRIMTVEKTTGAKQ